MKCCFDDTTYLKRQLLDSYVHYQHGCVHYGISAEELMHSAQTTLQL